ncbi:hypothetical protein ELG64_09055 [Rhizobium leguminosarum]|uniref:hypothetical protein n=1 Tax=Rhizobium leguminosarum TaxID=384 RepID=UPI001030C01B|nr:hypothetical protein [Rhizobium leguminosarum]TBH23642.1 hypothetical protein ELG64_09055 [Rhizobium leguminosarum]
MNLLKPKAATTPIPEQAQFETQIDNIAGTKVERVKQPDGSYATVRSSLPMSAEDQAYYDTLNAIRESTINYIGKLTTDYNVDDIPGLKQYLQDYEATQTEAIDRAGLARTTAEEKALARFGQADSTAATQARDARGEDLISNKIQLSRDMSGIEMDARNQELSRQGSLYNLATGGITGQQSTQLGSLSGLVNSGLAQQSATQGYNNSVASVTGANRQAKADANQAFMNNIVGIASLAAAPFTGGASLAAGGMFSQATGGSASAKAGTSGGWANYGPGLSNQIRWDSARYA